MLQVVQAYDRAPIAEVPTDGEAALESKLMAADRVFRDRDAWLKPHERIAIAQPTGRNQRRLPGSGPDLTWRARISNLTIR